MNSAAASQNDPNPSTIWFCRKPDELPQQAFAAFNDPLVTRFRVGRYHLEDINDVYVELMKNDSGWVLRQEPSDGGASVYSDAVPAMQSLAATIRKLGLRAVSVFKKNTTGYGGE